MAVVPTPLGSGRPFMGGCDVASGMKLLVAVDGSEESEAALAYAADVADATGGSLTVVHAVDPDVFDRGGDEPVSGVGDARDRLIIESVADAEDRGLEIVEDAMALAADLGQPDTAGELLYGDPVVAITDFAEDGGFDTLYVGHRGRSERTVAFLGSVAEGVVERSTVPVTVVR